MTNQTSALENQPLLHCPDVIKRIIAWARKVHLARILTYLLTFAAIVSGIMTYLTITQSDNPFGPNPNLVIGLVLLDLVLLLVLGAIVSRRFFALWLASRRGSTGSRLQTRIILLFSLVSIIPTIIVASFSAMFFNFGIQSWFDERVSTALEESVAVAEAYLAEHKKVLLADTRAMSNDLSRSAYLLSSNKKLFEQVVNTQTTIRSLTESIVFRYDPDAPSPNMTHKILAQGRLSFALTFDIPSPEAMRQANNGQIVILTATNDDRVRALVKLENVPNTYLMVGRFVDNKVLRHMENTQGAATQYKHLQSKISDLQIKFSFIFVMVALLLLLVAIWLGFIFAGFFARPIRDMIIATGKVKEGDLSARVAEGHENDELATLGRAFNRMAEQLGHQREALILANQQLDVRRRFSEAVLAGVSAGVIALDANKKVSLLNRAAPTLLGMKSEQIKGKYLAEALPEMSCLTDYIDATTEGTLQEEIVIQNKGKRLTLLARITIERAGDTVEGYVVTFDDITILVNAQRNAAWSDVARRIAHEIKNPLTPIHLAAERLRKKYSGEITSDPETFKRYTDTIIRHVGDIGKMVEEFANFARMPAPTFATADICELVRNIIFSQQCANDIVHYDVNIPSTPIPIRCDERQINQALTNICKNAVESLLTHQETKHDAHINVSVEAHDNDTIITIADNGVGFPENLIDRLTEPYVTTRTKGTGLGLAIVRKIIEDHGATLALSNLKEGGACVTITFPNS